MSSVAFEPMISTAKWLQIDTFDRMSIGIIKTRDVILFYDYMTILYNHTFYKTSTRQVGYSV